MQESSRCPKISGGYCLADPEPWDLLRGQSKNSNKNAGIHINSEGEKEMRSQEAKEYVFGAELKK
jgi:hypothetical protein